MSIDTLRADRVGCYGAARARTPTIDRLAAEGVRYEVALSPAPLTLPSHATLLTGLDPDEHGVRHNGAFALGPEPPTLAERLRAAGYGTAAFVGAFVLDRQFGLARGFDTYDDRVGERRAALVGYAERRAGEVTDAFLAWLEGAPPRFFAWVHFYDPHASYDPPTGFALTFPGDPYAGEISYADAQLGRVLEALGARFDLDRTLVVVTSDHGEALGEHGEPSHSYGVYESTQRVPLVVRGPGFRGGRVEPGPVVLADVAPTLVAVAGAEPLRAGAGRDLREPRGDDVRVYHETLATYLDHGWSALYAARTPRWKYIRAPRRELYDLASDPRERRNVADAQPEAAQDLDAWLASRLEGAAPWAVRGALAPEDRARLEALGYVAPAAATAPGGDLSGPDPKDRIAILDAMRRAANLADAGRHAEAHALLAAFPDAGPSVCAVRASVANAAGLFVEAEADARCALARDPSRPDYLLLLGLSFEGRGRRDEAAEAYREAAAADPRAPEPWSSLGRVLAAAGDAAAAARHYERALELRPRDPEAIWSLAALKMGEGRVEEGRALLEGVDPPRDLAAVLRVAAGELDAGEAAAAAERLERALAGREVPPAAAALAAGLLEAGGRTEAALGLREQALAADPGSWERANDVAWTLALLERDLDRALDLARGAVRGSKAEPAVLDTLGVVHLARGEARRALEAADRALARAGPEVRPHVSYVRAMALAALGREAEARRAVAEALAAPARPGERWRDEAQALARRLGDARVGASR